MVPPQAASSPLAAGPDPGGPPDRGDSPATKSAEATAPPPSSSISRARESSSARTSAPEPAASCPRTGPRGPTTSRRAGARGTPSSWPIPRTATCSRCPRGSVGGLPGGSRSVRPPLHQHRRPARRRISGDPVRLRLRRRDDPHADDPIAAEVLQQERGIPPARAERPAAGAPRRQVSRRAEPGRGRRPPRADRQGAVQDDPDQPRAGRGRAGTRRPPDDGFTRSPLVSDEESRPRQSSLPDDVRGSVSPQIHAVRVAKFEDPP